jgi:transcriptional regulator with XRE-family HTH domain
MCARRKVPKLDLTAIGQRIRGLRGDLRQEEFAPQLNISQAQLSKVERGVVAPTLEVLFGLALKFEESIDWIVTGEEKFTRRRTMHTSGD